MSDDAARLQHLKRRGYVIIPVSWMTPENLAAIRADFLQTLLSMPEFTPDHGLGDPFVLGGFSALGNPSSFHNVFVRRMRQFAMAEVLPVFQLMVAELKDGADLKLEQIIDRMMYRLPGTCASPESWHRDEAKDAKDGDRIFGGWWNLDETDQLFSCVPRTHLDVTGHAGFAAIKDAAEIEMYKKNKEVVVVPPGSILLFYEQIVHEVLSKKAKKATCRLFLGWRLTSEDSPLFGDVEKTLETQAVMRLKSSQIPSMYARLHWTNWRSKIEDFTKWVNSVCQTERTVQSGANKGQKHQLVEERMQSLQAYGLPMYPKYEQAEKAMHFPGCKWNLMCGPDGHVQSFSLFHPVLERKEDIEDQQTSDGVVSGMGMSQSPTPAKKTKSPFPSGHDFQRPSSKIQKFNKKSTAASAQVD